MCIYNRDAHGPEILAAVCKLNNRIGLSKLYNMKVFAEYIAYFIKSK